MPKNPKISSDLRRDRNDDIIRRMRIGDALTSFDSAASWYPPRPIIKKDEKALKALYGGVERRSVDRDQQTAAVESGKVARLSPIDKAT